MCKHPIHILFNIKEKIRQNHGEHSLHKDGEGGEEQTICKSASRIPDCFGRCVEKYPRI